MGGVWDNQGRRVRSLNTTEAPVVLGITVITGIFINYKLCYICIVIFRCVGEGGGVREGMPITSPLNPHLIMHFT